MERLGDYTKLLVDFVAARRRHHLTSLRASVGGVPLADGAAEIVCLLDVIEHLDDPVAACGKPPVGLPFGTSVLCVATAGDMSPAQR
jgi:hypothetical protein